MNIERQHPKWYLSAPHRCPYLASKTASTVWLDPDHAMDNAFFSALLKAGFRRSGATLYRPRCRGCNACVSVRIAAADYRPNRAQRRTRRRNSDLETRMTPATFSNEHFDLYCRYQAWRHSDDRDPIDPQRYQKFMLESSVHSVFMEHRLNNRLAAVSVCDLPADGLSAVYTFFDPALKHRSLGTYAIMKQIDYVNHMRLHWLYLGYWIDGCKKMIYKTNFTPIFGYVDKAWRLLRA